MAKIKLPSYLKLALKAIVTIGALWFVFSSIPFSEVLETAKGLEFVWLIGAVLVFGISKLVSAFRLHHFLRESGAKISAVFNIKLYLLGMFYNLFLPGGVGGDGYKIYLLNRKTGTKVRKIFWAVLSDRLSGVMALLLIAIILYYFTILDAGIYQALIWVLIPLGISVAYILVKVFLPHFKSIFLKTSLLSLFVQATQALAALLVLRALGHANEALPYLFLFLVSSIIAMVPITIGGVGAREFTFLLGAEMLGIQSSVGIALSLLFYLVAVTNSLFGIIFILRPGELSIIKNTN